MTRAASFVESHHRSDGGVSAGGGIRGRHVATIRAGRDATSCSSHGDPLAEELGWERLGLPDRAGFRYAAALAAQWLAELGSARALRRRPRGFAASQEPEAGTQANSPSLARRCEAGPRAR